MESRIVAASPVSRSFRFLTFAVASNRPLQLLRRRPGHRFKVRFHPYPGNTFQSLFQDFSFCSCVCVSIRVFWAIFIYPSSCIDFLVGSVPLLASSLLDPLIWLVRHIDMNCLRFLQISIDECVGGVCNECLNKVSNRSCVVLLHPSLAFVAARRLA